MPEYLGLNPFAKIPTLVDGGITLFESRAIAKFLALTYAPGSLVPSAPAHQAKLEQMLQVEQNYVSGNLFKAVASIFRNEVGFAPSVDFAAITEALANAELFTGITFLEEALKANAATGPAFLVGNSITLAECALFTYFNWFEYMFGLKAEYGALLAESKLGNFLDSDAFPHLRAWWSSLKARPSAQLVFRHALPTLDALRNKEEFFNTLEYVL